MRRIKLCMKNLKIPDIPITDMDRGISILPFMPPGTIVTTPRSETEYVITEHGIANLRYKSVTQRVKALIGIAHPDFRDRLAFEAKKYRLD